MSRFILTVCVLLLGACGWFKRGDDGLILNPKDDYLTSIQHNELVVPEGLRELTNTDPFPIPPSPEQERPGFYPNRPPLPDAIYANDNRDEVRIQRLGDRRWLVVPEPPTTVWPKLKQFLAENAVAVTYDAPEVGRLNTEWLQIEDTAYRDVIRSVLQDAKQEAPLLVGKDRYLIRVEQGLRELTTEVHARHENDSVTLPARDEVVVIESLTSQLGAAEDELLSEIGAYIAARVSEQTVSKVALQIGSSRKASLGRDADGYPVLYLYLDYDRAWATLGQALDNADVEITNLDREDGRFEVNIPGDLFSGIEERKGFLCRVTFSCDKRAPVGVTLQVGGESQAYEVSVMRADGSGPLNPDLAQQVLVLIREYAA